MTKSKSVSQIRFTWGASFLAPGKQESGVVGPHSGKRASDLPCKRCFGPEAEGAAGPIRSTTRGIVTTTSLNRAYNKPAPAGFVARMQQMN